LTNEKIDQIPLSEVAKHLKASVGPIRTAEEFYTVIQNKSQQRDSDFVTITIPWMNKVEEILRYNETSEKRSVLTPNTYPLLLFSLIVAAPAITDMIPMLEPT
jgi:hypothetical protein